MISRTGVRLFLCLIVFGVATAWLLPQVLASRLTRELSPANEEGFRLALPGYEYSFPRDHGSHPPFETEWWYYTGHLQSAEGTRFGYQVTFFRTALAAEPPQRDSGWATRDIIIGHMAITDVTNGKFYFDDRISRAALSLAGAQTTQQSGTPRIWLDDWYLQFTGDRGGQQSVQAHGTSTETGTPFGLSLTHRNLKPPVIHGQNGISQKSAGRGQASHYYSLTRLETVGTLRLQGREYSVSGQSWFDHEFGSSQLSDEQVGWDWFSLQLEDGRELMLYQLRLKGGGIDPFSSGTLVEKDGSSRHLKREEFGIEVLNQWQSPRSEARYPARWRVSVPNEDIALEVTPVLADQELDTRRSTNITYWEGSVQVTGTQSGRGYVEMTGYADQLGGIF